MRRAYPDRRKLEAQCISAIAFVKNELDLLDSPCWIMLINIVAMDMLKSKMPPSKSGDNLALASHSLGRAHPFNSLMRLVAR